MPNNNILEEFQPSKSRFELLPLSVTAGHDGDELLQKMGLSRHFRKQDSKLPLQKQLRFKMLDPGFRFNAFMLCLKDVMKPKANQQISMISWEFTIFNTIKPMWYRNNAFAEFQHEMDQHRENLNSKFNIELMLNIDGKNDADIHKFILGEVPRHALLGLYVAISKRTLEWDSLTEKEKITLSEQVWAISVFFKEEIFYELTDRCPGILDNYPNIEKMLEMMTDDGDDHFESDEINSLEDLYIQIDTLVCMGLDDPDNIEYAETISSLLAEHLPKLKERLNVSCEAWTEILNDCIGRIKDAAPKDIFTDFNEPEFVQAFNSTWLDHLLARLNENVDETFLSDMVGNKIENISSIVPIVIERTEVFDDISNALLTLNASLTSASFKEKPELKRLIADKEEQHLQSKRARDDIIEAGYNVLLPDGLGLEQLAAHEITSPEIKVRQENAGAAIYWKKHGPTICKASESVEAENKALDETTPPPLEISEEIAEELAAPDLTEPVTLEETISNIDEAAPEIIEPVEVSAPPVEIKAIASPKVKSEPLEAQPVAKIVNEQLDAQLTHFVNSPSEAAARLSHFQQSTGSIPSIALENIALFFIEHDNLPMGATVLRLAEKLPVDGECLPYSFVDAAYHGQHTWKNNQLTITRVLNALNNLSNEEIEYWGEKRTVGRLVPYLLFAATFQPTLFAGNMTNAPRLLSSVADSFDAPVKKLIEELVVFTDRNNRLDIESLTDDPKREDKDGKAKLVVAVRDWYDKIINKQTGWAPVRNAMKLCLDLPDFAEVKRIIEKDDVANLASVRVFTDKYRNIDAQQELLQEQISNTAREKNNGHLPIEGNARKWFTKSIVDIVSIADSYVEMSAQNSQRSSDVTKFVRRFMGLLSQAMQHVDERILTCKDLEHSAGLRLVQAILGAINNVSTGNSSFVWEPARIDGWHSWPSNYLTCELGLEADDAEGRLAGMTGLLCDGIPETLVDSAIAKNNFDQALLLALYFESVSKVKQKPLIDKIRMAFDEAKHECKTSLDDIKALLDNAYTASIEAIDEEKHYQISAELEHLFEQLNNLTVLESITDIQNNLEAIRLDLAKRFDSRIAELKTALDDAVNDARVKHGADWIPSTWLDQVYLALEGHDTTIAEELLDHLKSATVTGESLSVIDESNPNLLKAFLAAEPAVYAKLEAISNPRDLVKEIQTLSIPELDFSTIDTVYKTALFGLKSLKTRSLDKDTYDFLVGALAGAGLAVTTPQFNASLREKLHFNYSDGFASISCKVKRLPASRGIVFFSEGFEEQAINIIWTNSQWDATALNAYLESKVHTINDRTVFLQCGSLSNAQRNDLASFCKSHKHSIYHLDLCMLTLMAGLDITDGNRFKTFLQLSLPWTYSNPYTGSSMQPAPPEMRYGRSEDIKSLTNMRNGAAIVFGGRQLGKTTLLKETQRLFHAPAKHHYAYMKQMDSNLDRATLSSDEFEKHHKSVWSTIYNFACESKMITQEHGLDSKQMEQALGDYFRKPGEDKLLVCLDEIDPILGLDAAHGFGIFRGLTGLVNQSGGRFKVVIAGLENVRRFADAPNYPLHQLGSGVQVSIMTPSEAIQLIREPLAYLGYEFESPLLINRISVETNRHPGLIHIFCHEIIKRLSERQHQKTAQNKVGSYKITASLIDLICKDSAIRQLICDRFNITLSLDLRYQLIAYSLIGDGQPSFTPSRAKSIVVEWAPDIFGPMTEAQFEAFLDELRGLGVLRFRQRSDNGKEYSLRNANILNLAGGTQAVEDKLLSAIADIKDNDPMSGHAFSNSERPSPLTLRDEKLLISDVGTVTNESSNIVKANSTSFSVGLLVGSEALGLNSQWLEDGLTSIGEEEKPLLGKQSLRYKAHSKKDTDLGGASGFKKMLLTSVDKQASVTPIMMFIEFTGELPIDQMLDLIDVANQAALTERPDCHRIRIVFLVTPKALWSWVQHPDLTQAREEQQTFIALSLWQNTALAHLLNKLNLSPTSTSLEQLNEYSQGWYLTLNNLVNVVTQMKEKRKKADGLTVSEIGTSYTPVLKSSGKTAESFLNKTGLMDVNWARPVLEKLAQIDLFDEEDFELELLDNYHYVIPQAALKWLSFLRLIEPSKRHKGNAKPTYRVNACIKSLLANQSLVEIKA